ncbi:hypothetical protein ACHAW5_010055 [Stephanodiscus triporus]|uniref:Helicase-associated domain-containing protein n=1 Tax=Stephanodiscus triporus TaxID=2934178 RepID=A0ABD3QMZ9_9STRA
MPKVSKIMSRRPKAGDDNDDVEAAVPSLPPIWAPDRADSFASAEKEGSGGNNKTGQEGDADCINLADDMDGNTRPSTLQVSSGGGSLASVLQVSPGGTISEKSHPLNASSNDDAGGGEQDWNAMLYELLLYKAQRGDMNVPHDDPSYRNLYDWITTQRRQYQDNKTSSSFLNADRIAVLDAIDFQWNLRGDTLWQKNFDALIVYKAEHGDVRVPRLYDKNAKLGEWVTEQRRQLKFKLEGKPNTMTEERKAKLDDLGFVWQVRDRSDWNDRYEKMLEFKKETGHCVVPQHYPKNRALGKWVAKQREQYRFYREGKHSFLTEERIDLLKASGFVWQLKGRGVKKSKSSKPRGDKAHKKSLAKMEIIEENGQEDQFALYPAGDVASTSSHFTNGTESDLDQTMPPLPSIMQHQFLQANMDVMAAHAANKQLMAALGLGGGANSNGIPPSLL